MDTSDIAKRMKKYEYVTRTHLIPKMPVIIRIDGKSFHTYTRGFKRPFDDILITAMQETMKYLCQNIQGCVLGYTQSDEITLVLVDYKKIESHSWFDYNVQKCASIAASMATMAFNKAFLDCVDLAYDAAHEKARQEKGEELSDEEFDRLDEEFDVYYSACGKAMFDARVFNLPKDEVTNNIYWRQLDATRNSIQMVGQANFSHKELCDKSCNQIQDMLMTQKGINWNDFPVHKKRGSCCTKQYSYVDGGETTTVRRVWEIDNSIPIFKGEGRDYIERLI